MYGVGGHGRHGRHRRGMGGIGGISIGGPSGTIRSAGAAGEAVALATATPADGHRTRSKEGSSTHHVSAPDRLAPRCAVANASCRSPRTHPAPRTTHGLSLPSPPAFADAGHWLLTAPKCGTSFGNTLVHFANQSLPSNASIEDDERGFMQRYPASRYTPRGYAVEPRRVQLLLRGAGAGGFGNTGRSSG